MIEDLHAERGGDVDAAVGVGGHAVGAILSPRRQVQVE